ncbi:hypothetical protein CHH75_11500 [Paenibacillus sp. 7541]|nr:hypothetical protein CHH75_11500 [Paenibacillus sp. 7541]
MSEIADGDAFCTVFHATTDLVPDRQRSQHGGFKILAIDQQRVIKGVFINGRSKAQIAFPGFFALGQFCNGRLV